MLVKKHKWCVRLLTYLTMITIASVVVCMLHAAYVKRKPATYTVEFSNVMVLENCRDGWCYDTKTNKVIGPDKTPFYLTSPIGK